MEELPEFQKVSGQDMHLLGIEEEYTHQEES